MREIYLDYAAATPLDARVQEAMDPYLSREYGNPSSIHKKGRVAKEAVESARRIVARILGCRPTEIIFTGSGTEAVNLAVRGLVKKRGHMVTSKIEHHAMLRAGEALEKEGVEVTYLDVDRYGLVDPKKVRDALRPDTVLVSVMYANNEIGAIEPIAEIGKVIKDYRSKSQAPGSKFPFFFTDSCQAAGYLDLNVQKLGVDLMALNSSKIYGPKGVGCLYARGGIALEPLVYGGGQEKGLRSGTENVAGIVGFARALELAQSERVKESARLAGLRDHFIKEVLEKIPGAGLNGHPTERLANNVNISIPEIEGEVAVIYLDARGIQCSTGSACSSVSLEPSHVIKALGKSKEYAGGSLRFTLGRSTTKEEIDYAMEVLLGVVAILSQSEGVQYKIRGKEKSLC